MRDKKTLNMINSKKEKEKVILSNMLIFSSEDLKILQNPIFLYWMSQIYC